MKNSTKNSLAFWRPKPMCRFERSMITLKRNRFGRARNPRLISGGMKKECLRAEKWVRQFRRLRHIAFITRTSSRSVLHGFGLRRCRPYPALISSYARLYCPACWNGIYHHDGTYCPQCGGIFQQRGSFVFGYHVMCTRCQAVPKHSKSGRNYTIRNCTYCGVKLHELEFRSTSRIFNSFGAASVQVASKRLNRC